MNQTSGNDQKPNFGHDFGPLLDQRWSPKPFSWVLPLLDLIHCCKLSLYAISRKTNEPNLAQIQAADFFFFFFSKIWLCQLLDIMVNYYQTQYQKKANDPILRKFSEERIMDQCINGTMDGRTERWIDGWKN